MGWRVSSEAWVTTEELQVLLALPDVLSLLRSGASSLCDPWESSLLTGLLKGSFIDRRVGMSAWGLGSAQAGVWALPFVNCGV